MKSKLKSSLTKILALSLGLVVAGMSPFSTQSAQAADDTWNVDAAGNWSTNGSWLSGTQTPGSTSSTTNSDTATFGNVITAARIVTVDANRNIFGINFAGNSSAYTLSGGNLLLTAGGVIQTSGGGSGHTDNVNSAITLEGDYTFTAGSTSSTRVLSIGTTVTSAATSGTTTLTLNGANTGGNAVGGAISNGGGTNVVAVSKSDAGNWTLSVANSYSGGTTLSAGTLLFGNDSAFGTGTLTLNGGTLKNNTAGNRILANNIAVGGNTILDMAGKNNNLNGNLSGSAALTFTNSGAAATLALSGTNSGYSGTITLNNNNAVSFNSATAGSASAAWVFNDTNGDRVRINIGNGTLNFGSLAGAGQMQNDTAATTTTISVGALNTNTTFSGTIKDNGTGILALLKTGTGTLSLTGGNAYSGGTTISSGTVALTTNNTVFGTGSVAIGASSAVNITFSGDATIGNVFTGTGTITAAGSTGAVTFSNASGLNGFTGTLNVNTTGAKKVAVSAAGENIGSGATVNITSGGTLYLNTSTASNDGVTFNVVGSGNSENLGAIRIESGSVIGATSSVVLGGNTSLGSNGGTGTINAGITQSTASVVTKVGVGTVVLGGTNTYTGGTTISAGTLQFGKLVSMPASGAVTANTGSTLAVNLGGTGEWATGTSGNGTVGGLLAGLGGQSGGTVTWSGAVNLGLDTTNAGSTQTYSGNIANVGTSLGINKLGTGTLTLSGSNTYTGQTTVSGGTLNYNGTLSSGAQINVGVAGGGNAVMNLQAGSSITLNPNGTNHIIVGGGITNTTGQGFLYQSGGAIVGSTGGTSPYTGLQIGSGASGSSYGYYNLSGGTASVSEVDVGGFNGAAVGVLDISGGTLTTGANAGWMIVERNQTGGGVGILNMTGGTLNYTGAAGNFKNNWGTAGTGTAIINVANATLSATNADISLNAGSSGNNGSASNFGEINLLTGGTLQAHSITAGSNAAGTRLLNFNGGTLKASTANTTFLNTLSAVNVFGNGGTIDNNGVAITIPVGLLAASGTGVSSVAITTAGTGYLGAPAVTFSGGAGTGAAGYAVISSGTISQIVITNPGTGYTSAPTITLTGGGGTGAAIGTVSTAANTSGGMTFRGVGTTTLTGANTYTGATTVSNGTLAVLVSGSISGTLALGTSGGSTGTLDVTAKSSFSEANISGNGIINIGSGKTVTATGNLTPDFGTVAGALNVTGNFTLASTAATALQIGGSSSGQFDVVNTSVAFTYGGTLTVTSLSGSGYDLSQAATYALFTAGSFAGDFNGTVTVNGVSLTDASGVWTGTNGGSSYTFTDTTGVLSVTAVPEPSTWAMLVGGVGMLGLWQKSRRRHV